MPYMDAIRVFLLIKWSQIVILPFLFYNIQGGFPTV